jgi:catechol 2,3-dioxygenase-like lactoylglutathione lyase family enzyme
LEEQDVRVKVFGDTAVTFVVLAIDGKIAGAEVSGRMRYTRTWVRDDGNWRVAAAHIVPAAQPPQEGRGIAIALDHSVIHVSDRVRSNAFYRDVVGAELIGDQDGVAMYRLGANQLNVHGPGLDDPQPLAEVPVLPGGSDLCFVWPGPVEGAIEHLSSHGIDVELGPVPRIGAGGDGTSVYFRDPDGSLLEFISYD